MDDVWLAAVAKGIPMKHLSAGAIALALASTVVAGPHTAAAMTDYKWKYRPLVVFAPNGQTGFLNRQRQIVAANRTGLIERNMVVVWVIGDRVTADLGPAPRVRAADLRNRFGLSADGFHAVLVGKDGGIKLSSSSPLGPAMLFGTIDKMPMRQNEMRRP